jgi:penicillin-binding protein 2
MSQKRMSIILKAFTILLICLAARFLYLQSVKADSLARSASAQRIVSSGIEKPRGGILDRNGIPFTNRDKKYTLVLKPMYFEEEEEGLLEVCSIAGLDADAVKDELQTRKRPVLKDIDEECRNKLAALGLEGVSVINSLQRYGEDSIARHVTGYLSKKDQVGQSGIEKFFEDVLGEKGGNTIRMVTDARNNLVKGLGYRINKTAGSGGGLDVMLTLDYHIQEIVEEVMARNGITGAVVVEDVNTGDIVAMASKPDFVQTSVESYLQSSGNELYNRAVAAYNLGSVFKIIDVAAYLEDPDNVAQNYYCPGYIDIGTIRFKCASFDEGGHGEIDLEHAFANSCNPYFIDMGEKTGYRKLIEMASRFGLGSETGIREQGIGDSAGNLPKTDIYYSPGDIANLSIGQGVLMATPLQVADIVAIIANGGIKNRVNIVDCITDSEGNKVKNIKVKEGRRIISREIAEVIKSLMESVTDFGTGTAASLAEYGGAAGKTGSAETGSKDVVHAWFAGYFPRNQPKYSMAVLAENGQYGGKVAAPVFAEIAAEIMKKGY